MLFGALPVSVQAQQYNQIQFQGISQTQQQMKFNYQIPYSGVVEIQLFDNNKELVYFNRYVQRPGEHFIQVKKSGFQPDIRYSYLLKYKEHELSGEVPL